jgi:hypothetical protein
MAALRAHDFSMWNFPVHHVPANESAQTKIQAVKETVMLRTSALRTLVRSVFVILILTSIPTFTSAQKQKSSAPSAPAPKATSQPTKPPIQNPKPPQTTKPATPQATKPPQAEKPAAQPTARKTESTPQKQIDKKSDSGNAKPNPQPTGPGATKPNNNPERPGEGQVTKLRQPGPFPNPKLKDPKKETRTITSKHGVTGRLDSTGHLTSASFKTRKGEKASISRGRDGSRTVATMHKDGTRSVSDGHGNGYSDHLISRGGRTYISRTYVVNGRPYAAVYNAYYYHGAYFAGYVPAYWYGPGFYGWAYNPWAAPIAWGWGWGAAPWFGFYGGYFALYPYYAGPTFWLTDYVIAANLQAAYAAGQQTAEASQENQFGSTDANAVTLTPEVKEAIAAEVKTELQAEQADSSNSKGVDSRSTTNATQSPSSDQAPAALDSRRTTFVVSATVSGQTDDGQSCSLTGGDVLTRLTNTPDTNQNVRVLVTTAKDGDCTVGTQVAMSIQDLQDMYNAFREKLDAGLGQLAKNQGTKGMPKAQDTATRVNADAQAQPDPNAKQELQDQQNEANQAEADVDQAKSEVTSSGSAGASNSARNPSVLPPNVG